MLCAFGASNFGANVLLLHAERKTLSKGMLKCSAS
jgi:hypothetical protein